MISYLQHGLAAEVTTERFARALAGNDGGASAQDLDRLAEVLVGFVLGVPPALEHAVAMSKHEQCGRAVTFATGSILTYVFDPDDLIAESEHGEIGLLDDAFLVHTFVTQLRMTYPFAEPDVGYVPPEPAAFAAVAALLPDGVAASLTRTSQMIIDVARSFFVGAADGRANVDHEPRLRVAEAVRALS